jgi:cytochrome oxidase Cu insertion factor (SCO1/SenC/PrrC family)
MQDPRTRGRRTLLLVAAVFLVPVAVAFTLYYGKLWRPAGSASKGELIEPARPLSVAGLRQPDGSAAGSAVLAGKWTILYVGDGRCDAACRTALVFSRQTRLALNKEMTRVQRVFLATGNCCDTDYFAREQDGLVALDASSPDASAFLAQFPGQRANSLYIIDPFGNLVLRHDASHTSKDLLSDLKKLLKLSHIG